MNKDIVLMISDGCERLSKQNFEEGDKMMNANSKNLTEISDSGI